MKNNCTIICTAIGGAILGSAITCFIKSKRGMEMRLQAQDAIREQLNHIHEHIKGCKCTSEGCDCDGDEQKSGEAMSM